MFCSVLAQDSGFLLARKIKELGLDVQYIVGVHGMKRDINQLQAAIQKRRKRHAADHDISLPEE